MTPQHETTLPERVCAQSFANIAHIGHVFHQGDEEHVEYFWCSGFAWKPLNREELIAICEAAIVSEDKWSNRDTPSAQEGVGKAWAFLKAGCDFRIMTTENAEPGDSCVTDGSIIWIKITHKTFSTFEHGMKGNREVGTFYLPTRERLKQNAGRDWY